MGGRYFRSVWEANYARLLNYRGIIWEYEPKTFYFDGVKRGANSYLPDFFLPKDNEYHEVKGWMKPTDRTKLKRMAKYYPNIKIILIDSKIYLALERKWGFLVLNWEYSTASQCKVNGKDAVVQRRIHQILLESGVIEK